MLWSDTGIDVLVRNERGWGDPTWAIRMAESLWGYSLWHVDLASLAIYITMPNQIISYFQDDSFLQFWYFPALLSELNNSDFKCFCLHVLKCLLVCFSCQWMTSTPWSNCSQLQTYTGDMETFKGTDVWGLNIEHLLIFLGRHGQ